jgi:O-antigen/teichoic acid export membrane protein
MSSSQPENRTRNILSSYLNNITVVLAAFIITPVLTHHLGVVGFGVWALVGSLIPYFELVELGFANSTVSFVSKHLEAGDDDMVHRTLNTSFFLLIVPGLVAAAIAIVVTIFLPDIVPSIPAHLIGQARILLLLLAFDMVVSVPMDTFGGSLIALQRYDLLNASLITVMLLQTISWFVILELHGGLVALGVATVVISLGGQTARFIAARRLMPGFSLSWRGFDRSILRSFTVMSGWFSLMEVSGALINGVDVVIVGIVVGVRGAAIFAVGQRLGTLPSKMVGPPTAVVFPFAARLAGRGDRDGLRRVNQEVTRQVMALVVPPTLALMLLSTPIIRSWVGSSFHQSAEVAIVLAGAAIAQAFGATPQAIMAGSGQPKVQSVVLTLEALLHVGLGIVLCRIFGVIGAPFTGLICIVVLESFVLVPILYRKLEMRLLVEVSRVVRAHAVPTLVAGAFGWTLARWWLDSFAAEHGRLVGITAAGLAGLVVMTMYYAIFAVTGMDQAERGRMTAWARTHLIPGRST